MTLFFEVFFKIVQGVTSDNFVEIFFDQKIIFFIKIIIIAFWLIIRIPVKIRQRWNFNFFRL